jgi:hypothetical protein
MMSSSYALSAVFRGQKNAGWGSSFPISENPEMGHPDYWMGSCATRPFQSLISAQDEAIHRSVLVLCVWAWLLWS